MPIIEEIGDETEARMNEALVEFNALEEGIQDTINLNEGHIRFIRSKVAEIEERLRDVRSKIKAKPAPLKKEMEKLKEEEKSLEHQQEILDISLHKASQIQRKMALRMQYGRGKKAEIMCWQSKVVDYDFKEGLDPADVDQNTIYYTQEGDDLHLRIPDALGILSVKIVYDFPGTHLDLTKSTDRKILIARLLADGHYLTINDDISVDEKLVTSTCLSLDEVTTDINTYIRMSDNLLRTANNPEFLFKSAERANIFLKVLALSDIEEFKKSGRPYFRDEIFKSGESLSSDSRLGLSLEGKVICRGVKLSRNEYKRSTYTDNRGQDKIITDTIPVKSKDSHETIKVVQSISSPLNPDEQRLAAIKFAKELLLHYKLGSGLPIIISGSEKYKDQAARVHAALLMLTSVSGTEEGIALDPKLIKVDIKGCKKPAFFATNSNKKFIKLFFPDESIFKREKEEITRTYKALRKKVVDKKDTADIKVGAGDDRVIDDITPTSRPR